jgi:hypothetical protein
MGEEVADQLGGGAIVGGNQVADPVPGVDPGAAQVVHGDALPHHLRHHRGAGEEEP